MARRSKLQRLEEQVKIKALELEAKALDIEQRNLKEAYELFGNWVDLNTPLYDDPSFLTGYGPGIVGTPSYIDRQNRGEYVPVFINWQEARLIWQQSRRQAAFNPFALNILENRVSYIIGTGFKYQVHPRKNRQANPKLAARAQDIIDEFQDRHDWPATEAQTCFRTDRDGETFQRIFDVGHGRAEARFVEPEYVRGEEGETKDGYDSFGIVTDPDDIANVIAYQIVENPQHGWSTTPVDAREIVHIKANVDSSAKRGIPLLMPVFPNLDRAVKLLRNMSIIAQVRSTYAVIRRSKGSNAQAVSALQTANNALQTFNPVTGQSNYFQHLAPGTITDSSHNTEWEFPGMDLGASDLVEVLQAELRSIASRCDMPEFMVSSNAENANYTSTFVAESPAVKNFERWQQFYCRHFGAGCYSPNKACGVMWRVLKIAVDGNRLPAEALTDLEIQVETPSLIVRDRKAETDRYKTLHDAGVLSLTTWSHKEDIDPETEREHFASEEPQPAAPQGPPGSPAPTPGPNSQPAAQATPEPPQESPGEPEGDIDPATLVEPVKAYFAQMADLAGEEPPELDEANILAELQKVLSGQRQEAIEALIYQAIASEGCVPNQSGKGYHDDKTGHPCSPGLKDKATNAVKGGIKNATDKVKGVAQLAADKYTAAAGNRCTKILKTAGGLSKEAGKAAVAKAVQTYQGWEQEFGRSGAIAVAVCTVAIIPAPIPGGSILPALAAKGMKAVFTKTRSGGKSSALPQAA